MKYVGGVRPQERLPRILLHAIAVLL